MLFPPLKWFWHQLSTILTCLWRSEGRHPRMLKYKYQQDSTASTDCLCSSSRVSLCHNSPQEVEESTVDFLPLSFLKVNPWNQIEKYTTKSNINQRILEAFCLGDQNFEETIEYRTPCCSSACDPFKVTEKYTFCCQ